MTPVTARCKDVSLRSFVTGPAKFCSIYFKTEKEERDAGKGMTVITLL